MNETTQSQGSVKLKKTLRCALVALLALALLLPFNLPSAYATPTSAEKQAEADEVSAQLAASEEQMLQLRDDYNTAVAAHDAALAGMEEAQGRIDAAEAIIIDTQERLGVRANQMYKDGPFNFINVIFGAASFEEFTTTWDLINAINQENAELIQANKDARFEAQAAHDEYSAQEQVAMERETEAQTLYTRAEQLVTEQQALLAGLEAEVAELVAAEQEARRAADAAAAQASSGYNPDPNFVPPPIPDGGYGDVVAAAASRIGCPYVSGGKGPGFFDCSGLTSWCYSQTGRGWIGSTDYGQRGSASASWAYTSGGAQPGDVLWWPGHVAIYAGGGSYIHAPQPGEVVCYSSWNINAATVLRF